MPDYLTPLDPDALRSAGIPDGWRFGHMDRVRFYELDALNHVNNTAYLRWFETLRVEWFKAYGFPSYGAGNPTFVLRAVACDYHAPLFLHDDYIVCCRVESFRNTSFRKEYAVFSGGALKAQASAVIVMTDQAGTTKMPISDNMREIFIARDGATQAR